MHGDTLTTAIFFAGSGIALVIAGITQAGWKHRILIWGLLGFGVVFCATGLLWPFISGLSPAFTSFITSVATTPASWFTVFMFGAALVLLSPPKGQKRSADEPPRDVQDRAFKDALAATNARFDAWKDELCGRIESGASYRDKQDKALFEVVEKIQKQIAVDHLPNASTVAEAFKNLDDAVQAKIGRITEQTDRSLHRLRQDNLDLLHLLYFALQLSSESQLVHLLSQAPEIGIEESSELTDEAYQRNSNFLEEVARGLFGSQRYNPFQNLLMNGEQESDRRLKALPHSQWTDGLNPIDLRRYFIAAFTRRIVVDYLTNELVELRANIRDSRDRLLSQYQAREKEGRSS